MATLTEPEQEQFADVVAAYAHEVDMASRLRIAWRKAGHPADSELVGSIRACDRTVAHLARTLRLTPAPTSGKVGRPTGAVSAPDRAAGAAAEPAASAEGEPAKVTPIRRGA